MITSKQRRYLKSLAHNIDATIHIGKGGVSENVIMEIDRALEVRELVKVKLLEASMLSAKETGNELCSMVKGEFVQSIGNKFTLYRESVENKTIVLPRV